jgi:hypothetical protein
VEFLTTLWSSIVQRTQIIFFNLTNTGPSQCPNLHAGRTLAWFLALALAALGTDSRRLLHSMQMLRLAILLLEIAA